MALMDKKFRNDCAPVINSLGKNKALITEKIYQFAAKINKSRGALSNYQLIL